MGASTTIRRVCAAQCSRTVRRGEGHGPVPRSGGGASRIAALAGSGDRFRCRQDCRSVARVEVITLSSEMWALAFLVVLSFAPPSEARGRAALDKRDQRWGVLVNARGPGASVLVVVACVSVVCLFVRLVCVLHCTQSTHSTYWRDAALLCHSARMICRVHSYCRPPPSPPPSFLSLWNASSTSLTADTLCAGPSGPSGICVASQKCLWSFSLRCLACETFPQLIVHSPPLFKVPQVCERSNPHDSTSSSTFRPLRFWVR